MNCLLDITREVEVTKRILKNERMASHTRRKIYP